MKSDLGKLKILAMACVLLGALVSCSTALKKQCKETNWFQYGVEVAKKGQRPDQDSLVQACKREDFEISEGDLDKGFKLGMNEYCTLRHARLVGEGGDPFNMDLCDSRDRERLLGSHRTGLDKYCAQSNGFSAGATGKRYLGVCTQKQELSFLPEYKKGRAKHLQEVARIADQEIELASRMIAKLEDPIQDLVRANRRLTSAGERLNSSMEAATAKGLAPSCGGVSGFSSDLSSLRSEVSDLENQLSKHQQTLNAATQRKREAELELVSL